MEKKYMSVFVLSIILGCIGIVHADPLTVQSITGGAYYEYEPNGDVSRIRVYSVDDLRTFECDYSFSGDDITVTRKIYDSPHAWHNGVFHNAGLGSSNLCSLTIGGTVWNVEYNAENALQSTLIYPYSLSSGKHIVSVSATADDGIGGTTTYTTYGRITR